MRILPPFVVVCVVLSAISPAAAQTPRPERPYRGLFGGGAGNVINATESLTFTGGVGGGWDTSIAADVDPGEPLDPATTELRGAGYGLFNGSLVYSKTGERLQFSASGSSSGRYYPSFSEPLMAAHMATAGINYRTGRATTLSLAQSFSYQPFGTLNLFPGLNAPTLQAPDVAVANAPSLNLRALRVDFVSYATDAGINHNLSDRTTVSGTYSYRISHFGGNTTDFTAQSVAGRLGRAMTRNLTLRLGYGYTQGRFPQGGGTVTNHLIDSGVNYTRPLSSSRRTIVSFDTGATAFSDGATTQYNVIGGAILTHEIGRTWNLAANYRRGVQWVETLNQPLFTDAVNVALSGFVSRRLEVTTSVGASQGNLGFVAAGNGLRTYFASASAGTAISEHLSLISNYSYFSYALDGNIFPALGFVQDLNRHSVSVALSVWAPVFQRGRRTNASR